MPEYIEREAAKKLAETLDNGLFWSMRSVLLLLKSAPVADVAPVRHGRWVWTKDYQEDGYEQYWACSECGEHNYYQANYCPNCGAKMDLGEGMK